jgi:hypothetical protein
MPLSRQRGLSAGYQPALTEDGTWLSDGCAAGQLPVLTEPALTEPALTEPGLDRPAPSALVPLLKPPNSTDKMTSTMIRPRIKNRHPLSLLLLRRGRLKPSRMSPPAVVLPPPGAGTLALARSLSWRRPFSTVARLNADEPPEADRA